MFLHKKANAAACLHDPNTVVKFSSLSNADENSFEIYFLILLESFLLIMNYSNERIIRDSQVNKVHDI